MQLCLFKKGYLYALFLLIIFCGDVSAQSPYFKNYNVESGLPSSEVYNVLQDKKGYIWFATDGGVCRFDGTHFKTYTTKDGLCDNTILNLYEDPKGRVWFYSFSGKLSYFYNDSIHNFLLNDKLSKKITYYGMCSIAIDNNDTIWIGEYITHFYKMTVDGSYAGTSGRDTVGMVEGPYIKLIKPGKLVFTDYRYLNNTNYISNLTLSKKPGTSVTILTHKVWHPQYVKLQCIMLKDSTYLVAFNNDLVHFDDKKVIKSIHFSKKILSVYEDNERNVWVGLFKDGVLKITPENRAELKYERYLDGKTITGISEDKEGGYWLTSLDAGVFYTPSIHYSTYNTDNGLSDNKLYGLIANKNSAIIFLQNKDMYEIDNKTHEAKQIKIKDFKPKGISVFDNEGNLWVAGEGVGNIFLLVLNKNRQIVKAYNKPNTSCLYSVDDNIIQGLTSGVRILKSKNADKGFIEYHNALLRAGSISKRGKDLYIGALNGLWVIDSTGLHQLADKHPLFSYRITDIKNDSRNNLWIATKGAGIIIYTPAGKIFQITEKQGLVNDLCNAVSIDSTGVIWVGTNNGLSKISLKNGDINQYKIENYNTSNGLVSNQVTFIQTSGKTIWLGTNNGVSMIGSDKLKINGLPPPVYINSIKCNDYIIISKTKQTVFSHTENTISFNYSGLTFKNAGKIRYKYILQGLDTTIVYTNSDEVRFAELPYGYYTFKVWASNNNGVWSSCPARFSFIIRRAFYQTIWFITIVILLGLLVVVLVVKISNEKIKEKEFLKQQMIASEQKTLRLQMNPHFIFNSLNSIQRFVMKNNKLMASDYLSKFANLMRAILENSQETYITLEEELNSLKLYLDLEALRFEGDLNYSVIIDEKIDQYDTQLPPMLIQPYVENAIKHGLANNEGNGQIEIHISKEKDGILFTIKDNGIGRQKAGKLKLEGHKSLGTRITQERIDTLNNYRNKKIFVLITDLYSKDGAASGTQVDLFIPENI